MSGRGLLDGPGAIRSRTADAPTEQTSRLNQPLIRAKAGNSLLKLNLSGIPQSIRDSRRALLEKEAAGALACALAGFASSEFADVPGATQQLSDTASDSAVRDALDHTPRNVLK